MRNEIDFFISYSTIDRDWVLDFIEEIENHSISYGQSERKIKVFYDNRDIEYGASVTYELVKNITSSRFFLLVMSPECFESEWTQREYAIAQVNHKKIIPLYLRDSRKGDKKKEKLAFGFNDLRFIDFRDDSNFDMALQSVLNLLKPTSYPPVFETDIISNMFSFLDYFLKIVKNTAIQKPHFIQHAPTLETAPHYVMDSICWAMDKNAAILGCAWRWRDDLLLGDETLGRAINDRLSAAQVIEIKKAEPDSYSNMVTKVSSFALGRLAGLSVWADCWMPFPIALQKHYSIPTGGSTVELAAISYQGPQGGQGLKPSVSHFTLGPGNRLQRTNHGGIIAPGTPLFDRSAKLIGTINKTLKDEWILKPFTDAHA